MGTRLRLIVPLGVTLLTTVNSAAAAPEFPNLVRSLGTLPSIITGKRLLRIRITVNDSDGTEGERAIMDVVEKLKTSRMFAKWIKEGVSTDEAYKLLKIGAGSGNVLGSRSFVSLVKYVDEFNMKNPGNKLWTYKTLENKFG
ncbi:unnamed protein product [Phytophthora lilii]|uniref:RxLR effector protein n=1 Tax=Phytophthora lilii TaxID=2077276 RepID=A0A9W6TUU5_9STRA|nr:unnamed protein product [Phytophthora lilii]